MPAVESNTFRDAQDLLRLDILEKDFILKESEEDCKAFGKITPKTYRIAAGNYICINHGTLQMDPRLWKDPSKFDPYRFLVEDENNPGGLRSDKLHPSAFGGGPSICKGRTYAEREVLIFVAALLVTYDLGLVGKDWHIPGKFMNGTGAAQPTGTFRVNLNRRA
ncbi:Protopine 6-monooxygenase [Lachnellula suecica]|uniref:Protopine 6-monooxygenase n=1 Tax=Lachnellula suecica TaxID=602035 RepID=A0A8T9CGU9_9HELO|nr:Protopine 6-monooxygenase [Lachnellula suecica]